MMERVLSLGFEDELKYSYLDYAMSVIVGRAIPDARDGLKPVQRRILFAMKELNLRPGSPFKKSARVVGEVLGKYHPHGDASVYEALVRMAQDFSYRYTLVDGQGNFGSIDGDPPAAMRYTEARLSPLGMELLGELEEETVDWMPNFDGSLEEPSVLPAKFPNLLVNGTSGIAVGMASSIPSHNLGEIIDALIYLIDNPQATVNEIMRFVPGPDFPTGGIVCGVEGIKEYMETGRGKILLRGRAHIERGKVNRIVITEIPYNVSKALLIKSIADLVKMKKIEGISDLRDESDRRGMRIVIELSKGASPEAILGFLYKHTQLETTFGVINLALVDNAPRVMGIKDMMQVYIDHRKEVVRRRTSFRLKNAERRAHILLGFKIALDHIDLVISLIRGSQTQEEAKVKLMERLSLSELQAEEILKMPLGRLTNLERSKIEEELEEKLKLIAELKGILESESKLLSLIKEELLEIKGKYGDKRRTEILKFVPEEPEIPAKKFIVTLSREGYLRFREEGERRGRMKLELIEGDVPLMGTGAETGDKLLIFTSAGKVFSLELDEKIPLQAFSGRGINLRVLFDLGDDRPVAFKVLREGEYIYLFTKRGLVKKIEVTLLGDMKRRSGRRLIRLDEGDEIVRVRFGGDSEEMVLLSSAGKGFRIRTSFIRASNPATGGVRAMVLSEEEALVGADILKGDKVLVVTSYGYVKGLPIEEIPFRSGPGRGAYIYPPSDKHGRVIGCWSFGHDAEILAISRKGVILKIKAEDIPILTREKKGQRLFELEEGDEIVDVLFSA
ncbi:MAG: DNA gyrase subunit A [Synergistetes bacterium]|nr:DNA gyrase subunit A [Synergistota bacterium]MDW8191775.1 DNA gyrase subunit A [Synergistota bacterium]